MASQGVAANSRLAEMQMKFQKKQMLEREQKKMALTGGDFSQATKSTIGNGKVRQMFDDRRRGVGIDRSHPLKPIVAPTISVAATARNTIQQVATGKRLVAGADIPSGPRFSKTPLIKNTSKKPLNNNLSVSNGNINIFQNNLDEIDNIDNETFPKEFSSLSLNNTRVLGSSVFNDHDLENNNNLNTESDSLGGTIIINRKTSPKTNDIKLNPVITKKSPATATGTRTAIRTPSSSSRASTLSKSTTNSVKSPPIKSPRTTTADKINKVAANKTSNTKPATFALSVKPPPKISTPPPGMASCQHCQRHFSEERLGKHEEVCRKMMTKKRKIFDAAKHRVKGTEAEKYLKKGKTFSTPVAKSVTTSLKTAAPTAQSSGEKKSNWRKKHEEFIAAIREAKKVQAYLAKGGKLSDLPPPPPSENADYIQCPHCGRRFNESAAERHIPKCANMKHNKPKPAKKRY